MASGFKKNGELYIHQDAALSLANPEKGKSITYSVNKEGNGVYIMVINGEVEINGEKLSRRDAIGISETNTFTVSANENSELLIVEVPMK